MNFLGNFFIALAVILVSIIGAFVVVGIAVIPTFVPMLFGLTGGTAVAIVAGLYIVLGAAFMAAVADF
jgi:hypothetical protein